MISLLFVFLLLAGAPASVVPRPSIDRPIACEGTYPHHLQGVCADDRGGYYWSFTTRLVQTDSAGKVRRQVEVANHHGDLCFVDGKLYVAVNLGKFNDPEGKAGSWIYVYNASDLSFVTKQPVPEVAFGAGGVAYHDGRFLVVGGLPPGFTENYAYEYDRKLAFRKKHVLKSGYTLMGIQTAAYVNGSWWFGCYGEPKTLLRADETLQEVRRYEFDCSLGIVGVDKGCFLIARGVCGKESGCRGELLPAAPHPERGLAIRKAATGSGCCPTARMD